MHLSEISVKRPVAVAMFFLGVVLIGTISLSRLSVDLLPDLAYPKLTIWTTYPDVGPTEIEEFITKPIEEAVGTVPGVRRISSLSKEGVSLVALEFVWGTNMDFAALNVREKLDQLRWSLPRQAGRPTILRLDPRSQPIMSLSVAGEDLVALKELARNVIKRRLEQIKGVAMATVTGGLEREIQVEVDSHKLTALGLSIEQIAQALKGANFYLPGGTIKKGRYRYSLRTLGEFQTVDEISHVVIGRGKNGSLIHLNQVAQVTDGFREREAITRFNGKEAIGVIIKKEAGANTVKVSQKIKEVLGQLGQEYPGVKIAVAYDQARFISESISNVQQAILMGGILAFLVLFLFLHDFRNPVNIAIAIPVSIIATFNLLYFTNVSLNMMSLGGLALGVGMLVDNSIVVLENIFRHRQEGVPRLRAAFQGAREVAMPVTASTLTTVAVFLPIIYVHGVAGQLFRDQALTVTFSLLASLLVSLTLLPMLAARFLHLPGEEISHRIISEREGREPSSPIPEKPHTFLRKLAMWISFPFRKLGYYVAHWAKYLLVLVVELIKYWFQGLASVMNRFTRPVFRVFDRYFEVFAHKYEALLQWALAHRLKILAITALALVVSALLSLTLDRKLMPEVDQGEFTIEVVTPPGTTLDETSRVAGEIEDILTHDKTVAHVFSNIGILGEEAALFLEESGLNRAKLQVRLVENRHESTTEIMARLREKIRPMEGVEVAFSSSGTTLKQVLGTSEADVAIKISGDELEVSKKLLAEVKSRVQDVPGLKDLHSDFEEGRPEIRIEVNREAANRYSFTVGQVARFIKSHFRGDVATQFKDFDRKIDVLIRPQQEERDELVDLLETPLHASQTSVPLRELIRYKYTRGPTEIRREDQQRQIVLYGNVEGRSLKSTLREIEKRVADIDHPYNYQITVGGEREEMARSFRSLFYALILAIVLVYMILSAQFESLIHPFVIMFAVPLALIGVAWGLFLTGQGFNVMSLIGMVVLVGIVVNDAIIKVDFINQERKRGASLHDAIIRAGQKRLRPIIMTTVTTVLGLTPMAIGYGAGAELRRPLAIAVIAGLLSATFLTLIVIPVIYSLLAREKR